MKKTSDIIALAKGKSADVVVLQELWEGFEPLRFLWHASYNVVP